MCESNPRNIPCGATVVITYETGESDVGVLGEIHDGFAWIYLSESRSTFAHMSRVAAVDPTSVVDWSTDIDWLLSELSIEDDWAGIPF